VSEILIAIIIATVSASLYAIVAFISSSISKRISERLSEPNFDISKLIVKENKERHAYRIKVVNKSAKPLKLVKCELKIVTRILRKGSKFSTYRYSDPLDVSSEIYGMDLIPPFRKPMLNKRKGKEQIVETDYVTSIVVNDDLEAKLAGKDKALILYIIGQNNASQKIITKVQIYSKEHIRQGSFDLGCFMEIMQILPTSTVL